MKKNFFVVIVFFILFCLMPKICQGVKAATLNFDKQTVTVNPGDTFQITVVVDAGSDTISSTDAYVLYDATLIEADSVQPGTFFPTVTNNITSGRIYIAGLVDDPATYKTGSGSVATVSFKALKNGSGTLTFDCQQGSTNTSKVIKNDINATNIIVCSQNGSSTITIGSGSNSNVTPSVLPKTGVIENLTNIAVPGIILLFIGGALRLVL